MTAPARLTRMLVSRGLGPASSRSDVIVATPQTSVVQMRAPRSPEGRRIEALPAFSRTSVVAMRQPKSMAIAHLETPEPNSRLDQSLVPVDASVETQTPEDRQALMESVRREIREMNAEMERNARLGFIDHGAMEPWQARRRFGLKA